jgi:hypothetical protein
MPRLESRALDAVRDFIAEIAQEVVDNKEFDISDYDGEIRDMIREEGEEIMEDVHQSAMEDLFQEKLFELKQDVQNLRGEIIDGLSLRKEVRELSERVEALEAKGLRQWVVAKFQELKRRVRNESTEGK